MRLTLIAALLCFAAVTPPNAAAQVQTQASPATSVIAEVHADGSRRYSETQIAAAAGLKPGDNVTRDDIQAAADRLTNLGVFSRVNYRFSSLGAKIKVEFQMEDASQVPVSFDNFPWLADSELAAAIRQSAPLFDGYAPTSGAELDLMTSGITTLLKSRGLPDTVEHHLVAHPSRDGMLMQFSIDGPEITVDSIDFGDALARNSEQLRDRQQDLLHKPYSRFTLEVFENEQIRPLYISAGYLQVRFDEPALKIASAGAPATSPAKISVTLRIDPGLSYHLGAIDWSGVTAIPADTLASLMVQKPGDLADGMRLTAAWQRVATEYGHRGYLDVKMDHVPDYSDAKATVSYHVAVNEGPQYHMGALVLTGLSLDAERQVRAVWRLAPGAVFDGTYFHTMLAKLEKPSPEIFGQLPVHYAELGYFLRVDSDKHTADVLLDFK
jgi:outer membrane protein assembly factor BamA